MANSIYKINKGINKAIEFKGLKAQYIWYLGIVILALLVLFSILYFLGINQYICIVLIGGIGVCALQKIYAMSKKYGEHGLMKVLAKKMVPKLIKSNDRKTFFKPNKKK